MAKTMTKAPPAKQQAAPPAQAPAKFDGTTTLRKWLYRSDILDGLSAALGGWMEAPAFVASLLTSFEKPEIACCTPESLYKSVHDCAAMAFLPILQHVALIPRKEKIDGRETGRKYCTVMPQWQGYQALMLRNPEIEDVRAVLIHAKTDTYRFDPVLVQIVDHQYDPLAEDRIFNDFTDVRGGYLEISYRDRTRPIKHHIVHVNSIRKARACAQNNDFWGPWFMEQVTKTIYRNAYSRRAVAIDPLVQIRMQQAFALDDAINETTVIEAQPALPRLGATGQSRAAAVVQQMQGQGSTTPAPSADPPAGGGEGSSAADTATSATETPTREPGDESENDAETLAAEAETLQAQTTGPTCGKKGKGTQSLLAGEDLMARCEHVQSLDDISAMRKTVAETAMTDQQRNGLTLILDKHLRRLQGQKGA